MYRSIVNPWTWQAGYGYVQGVDVRNPTQQVFVAGQCSVDADGRAQHAGDMAKQLLAALENVDQVLDAAGLRLSDVVHMRLYVTDIAQYFAALTTFTDRLHAAGCRAAGTLVQIGALALPDLLVEIEVVAAT
ncbi:MAG: RidA family protein [Pseudonocardia sp.]|nr:RidA family protein [Pseudonocardia sp.]